MYLVVEGSKFCLEPAVFTRRDEGCNGGPVFVAENQKLALWVTKDQQGMIGYYHEVGCDLGLVRSEGVMKIDSNQAWSEFDNVLNIWQVNPGISVTWKVTASDPGANPSSPSGISEPYEHLGREISPTLLSKRGKNEYFKDKPRRAFKKMCLSPTWTPVEHPAVVRLSPAFIEF